jgi:C_GCAxxG_C_C family probable redox protein
MTHEQKARDLFSKGANCSQAVFAAFADELGMDTETALKLSSSFGGGMGRMREVCGACSGMFMVAGLVHGYSDLSDNEAKKAHYALIQKMAQEFRSENGSIVCRELLSGIHPDTSSTPTPRTPDFYKKRPCAEYVACAVRITENEFPELRNAIK